MAEIPSEKAWRDRTTAFGSVVTLASQFVDDCLKRGGDEISDPLKMAIDELATSMGRTVALNGMTPSEKKLFAKDGDPADLMRAATIGVKVYAKAKEDREAYLAFVTMRLKEAVGEAERLRSDLITLCARLKKNSIVLEDCGVEVGYWADQGDESA